MSYDHMTPGKYQILLNEIDYYRFLTESPRFIDPDADAKLNALLEIARLYENQNGINPSS